MNYGDHNFIEITQQTKLRVALVESLCRASRARRVERVELCCSTKSTQPKCMGSTRRTCQVVSSRAKWNFGFTLWFLFTNMGSEYSCVWCSKSPL